MRGLLIGAVLVAALSPGAAEAKDYFMSPTGSATGDGSAAAPWKTFAQAMAKLQAGDTLILKDGQYTTASAGSFHADCTTGPARNGAPGLPITIRAENERRAHLKTDGLSTPIRINNCKHYVVEGLHLSGTQNTAATEGNAGVSMKGTTGSVVRRNLIHDMNHSFSSGGITIWQCEDVVVEENEAYRANRNVIYALSSKRITFRRNYCYAGTPPQPQGTGGAQGPQDCMLMYSSTDGIFENNVSRHAEGGFGNCGQRNKYLGNIAINTTNGLLVGKHPGEYMPVLDNSYENNLALMLPGEREMVNGMSARSMVSVTISSFSVFGITGVGVYADNIYDPRQGPGKCGSYPGSTSLPCKIQQDPSISVSNTLVQGANRGFLVKNADQFAKRVFEHTVGWNTTLGTWGEGTETRDQATTPPPGVATSSDLKGCRVFIPASSSLKGKGKAGADIGANLLYAYEDGLLTSQPLWDPKTYRFRCGAVVTGVNDESIPYSCVNLHVALGVTACPFPPGYGQVTGDRAGGGSDRAAVEAGPATEAAAASSEAGSSLDRALTGATPPAAGCGCTTATPAARDGGWSVLGLLVAAGAAGRWRRSRGRRGAWGSRFGSL